jgi:hypothetical protein
MHRVLHSLLATMKTGGARRSCFQADQRVRLNVEGLEERMVPSAMSLTPQPVLSAAHMSHPFPSHRQGHGHQRQLFIPTVNQIQFGQLDLNFLRFIQKNHLILAAPNLQGLRFHLHSDSSNDQGPWGHELDIQTQTYDTFFRGSASFTGTWSPWIQSGTETPKATENGRIEWTAQGIHLTFSWGNGSHTFDGFVASVGGQFVVVGNVNTGPGHVIGDQA